MARLSEKMQAELRNSTAAAKASADEIELMANHLIAAAHLVKLSDDDSFSWSDAGTVAHAREEVRSALSVIAHFYGPPLGFIADDDGLLHREPRS